MVRLCVRAPHPPQSALPVIAWQSHVMYLVAESISSHFRIKSDRLTVTVNHYSYLPSHYANIIRECSTRKKLKPHTTVSYLFHTQSATIVVRSFRPFRRRLNCHVVYRLSSSSGQRYRRHHHRRISLRHLLIVGNRICTLILGESRHNVAI